MTENDPSAHDSGAPRPAQGQSGPAPQTGETAGQENWFASQPEVSGSGEHARTDQQPYAGQQSYPASGQSYTQNPPQAENPYASPSQHAYPAAGQTGEQQAYNPWSAEAQAVANGGTQLPPSQAPYAQQVHAGQHAAGPGTSIYGLPPQQVPRPARGPGKMLAGVALIALFVGGIAGGTVGYLSSGSGGSITNALDAPKPAQQTGNTPSGSVESVAQKLSPSVVELQVSGQSAAGEGSGFVLSTDGFILTNNHVVEVAANGGQITAVFQDGKKAPAKVIGRDPTTDIAVVKVDNVSGLTPVELGRSDDLKVGQAVVAIGSPFELTGTVTSGIVSSLHRPVSAGGGQGDQNTVMDAVQTDAAINPGNSGGPLANMAGQVIGINSAIYSPQSASGQGQGQGQAEGGNVGIGFAIPIDQARRTADDIIKTGQATQTFIGAKVQDAPQGGAQLGDITPGSPAEKAGLKSGDIVTKIDSRPIDTASTLIAAIRTRAPNEKVQMTVGGSRTVEVTLGGQPVTPN
ncbi:S1C family serine protease [Amycolatopsis sp. H20-H5]|uniref:S1C family serine protease n=1 Tax=Amycolatopsis sp. H20-H5 TaxID=3046309 RepID=UPI002DBE9A42|nr:trypsin-like peptidase domain-containing protein [Amycolatopsis sp. H20-H5]MEC3975196.1 trypsin-like peptidase domain-containing protein [Amycolatopsis sp. H20-H5]